MGYSESQCQTCFKWIRDDKKHICYRKSKRPVSERQQLNNFFMGVKA